MVQWWIVFVFPCPSVDFDCWLIEPLTHLSSSVARKFQYCSLRRNGPLSDKIFAQTSTRRTRYKRKPTCLCLCCSFNGWRARNNAIVSVFVSFVRVLLPSTRLKCCYWSIVTIAYKIIWGCFSANTDTFPNFWRSIFGAHFQLTSSFTVFSFLLNTVSNKLKVDHNKIWFRLLFM